MRRLLLVLVIIIAAIFVAARYCDDSTENTASSQITEIFDELPAALKQAQPERTDR